MFKTTSELQSFLIWCQQQAICHVKVDNIEVRFADIAFLDRITSAIDSPKAAEERDTSKTLVDTLPDDDDLLYYSAKS